MLVEERRRDTAAVLGVSELCAAAAAELASEADVLQIDFTPAKGSLGSGDELVCVGALTLHVDDILIASSLELGIADKLHKALEAEFGTTKRRGGDFRHYGIDVFQKLDHDIDRTSVVLSQEQYLKQLKPVALDCPRGSGRTADTHLRPSEVKDFRSLACGMA